MTEQIIYLHAQAPIKPLYGQTCNGCGVCCAAEPCPLGVILFRRRRGACAALVWDDAAQRYQCGVLKQPSHYIRFMPKWFEARLRQYLIRMIAAGRGCDSDAQLLQAPSGVATSQK